MTVGKKSMAVSDQSTSKTEISIRAPRKPLLLPPTLLPYTPPDALMFALFSAIQRKAWLRAKKLCYELILSDPLRKNYRDLHDRIDQIIRVMNQRLRSQPTVPSRTLTASSGNTDDRATSSRK